MITSIVNLWTRFSSDGFKKFSVFTVSLMLIMLKDFLELTPEQVEGLQVVAGGYLVGQGIADVGKGKAAIEDRISKRKRLDTA